MAIALGKLDHPLRALMEGARCSWFLPQTCSQTARKQWIAGSLTPAGEIMIDRGPLTHCGMAVRCSPQV